MSEHGIHATEIHLSQEITEFVPIVEVINEPSIDAFVRSWVEGGLSSNELAELLERKIFGYHELR